MRQILASLFDALMAALLGYAAFRIAVFSTPCSGNMSNCFPLTPVVIVLIAATLVLYFGLSHLLFRRTPGQVLLGSGGSRTGTN